jgi:hypothetical protein
MKKIDIINITFALVLTITIGFTVGYAIGTYNAKVSSFPDILRIADINPGVATLQMLEVRNGEMIGKVTGRGARLAYSEDEVLELQKGAYFKIPIEKVSLASYYQAETIPDEASFIASSQGKYYYHVLDKKALSITPENRLYFRTSWEAEAAGYKNAQ